MMSNDPTLVVDAYLDDELDLAHVLELEQRFASDPALAQERDRVQALRALIGDQLPRETAPAGLASRIETAAGLRRTPPRPTWSALAASVALAALFGSGATHLALDAATGNPNMTMVVDSHLRALMAPAPTDVSSSDRHTVKPWFTGRITQSPRVVDLTNEGFPLLGGRIDVVGRNPVPALVYRHRQHLISLTAVPDASPGGPQAHTIAGYNVLAWTDNGVRYWAVSDLGSGDLDTFAKAFQASPDR
jgi:anti-sigma factor RsiW